MPRKLVKYHSRMDPRPIGADPSITALESFFSARLAANGSPGATGSGRYDGLIDDLEEACLDAGNHAQRDTLRAYVGEAQKLGWSKPKIRREVMRIVLGMKSFSSRDPWADNDRTRKYINGLFYPPGKIIGDATPEEAADLAGLKAQPLVAQMIRWASEIEPELVEWLWNGYIACGEMSVIDGEKSTAKSFSSDWIAARLTRGEPMPGQDEAIMPPSNVLILTDEGHWGRVQVPRLMAAGANMKKIALPETKVPRRGDKVLDWDLSLPDGAENIKQMIIQASARLVIFDPITDFLSGSIDSHNDAKVRSALAPLARVLYDTDCAAWMIRHMNKDTKADAKYRGSGSMAFQNRARVHMVMRPLPDSARLKGIEGQFGIAVASSNNSKLIESVLCLSVVDSNIKMDSLGNMVGVTRWHGYADVDILRAEASHPGPPASPKRVMCREYLFGMFSEKDTWPAEEVEEELRREDLLMSQKPMERVREELGIRSEPVRGPDKGITHWVWTVAKAKATDGKGRS